MKNKNKEYQQFDIYNTSIISLINRGRETTTK
jgi:hypothetical protein